MIHIVLHTPSNWCAGLSDTKYAISDAWLHCNLAEGYDALCVAFAKTVWSLLIVCECTRTHSFHQGLVQFETVCIPWFQKLPVWDECENCLFLKTLVRLSVLAPVFSSFQNWQFLNQSAKLLPKIETVNTVAALQKQDVWFLRAAANTLSLLFSSYLWIKKKTV